MIRVAWLVAFLTAAPTSLALQVAPPNDPKISYQDILSFRSFNYPDSFLSYNNAGDGKLLDILETKYFLRPGLTGNAGTVSFESVDKPNFFLRHYNYLIDLEDADSPRNPNIFKLDATFRVIKNKWHPNTLSFESVNYPSHFLRHQNFRLRISPMLTTALFKADASWKVGTRQVPYGGHKSFESFNFPNKYLSFTDANSGNLNVQEKKYFLRPGLTGDAGTVSFESVDKPNFFLRHYNYLIALENADSPRNPNIFKLDATFRLHQDKWHPNTVSFESINYPNFYIRHQNFNLKISEANGTPLFKADASWNNMIVHVLLDVSGSLQAVGGEQFLKDEVDIMDDLFDYVKSDDGYMRMLGKISSIKFTPFNSRLLPGEANGFSPSKYTSANQLQNQEGPRRAQYAAQLLALGPRGLTDIGKSLKQILALSKGHFTVIVVSDFRNTINNINPVNVVQQLTAIPVQVFPILLDAPFRSALMFSSMEAASVDKMGYDDLFGVSKETFREIFETI